MKPDELVRDIGKQISACWVKVRELDHLSHYIPADGDHNDEERDVAITLLLSHIEKLHVSLSLALESMG